MRGRLVIILVLALLLAGCRQAAVEQARLVALDSLIAVSPDSAAALLEAYPDDSLRTAGDRAYRALLLTQARYKAYIPATGDSLISMAVEHYADGHDPDKRTRSLLYKGCVLEEMSRLDSAMHYFLEAGSSAQAQGQNEHQAYIMFHIAQLYQYSYTANDLAVQYYHRSLDRYRQLGDSLHVLYCLSELAALYRNTAPDSVVITAEQAKSLARALNNGPYYCVNLGTLAGYYLYADNYVRAKELAIEALSDSSAAHATKVLCLNTACQAMALLGKCDSAQLFLSQIPAPSSVADSLDLMRSQALVAQVKGDMTSYIDLSRLKNVKAEQVLLSSLRHQLAVTQAQYESEQEKLLHSRARMRSMVVLVLLLALLLCLAVSFFIFYRRSVNGRLEWERARAQLSEQLALMANQGDIHRLRIHTVTQALACVSYLGKRGSSSFKENKDLDNARLPEQFWTDADQLISSELSDLLSQMEERGETLKTEERRVLSMCFCGIPDVVIAKLMNYTNRQTVQNIKSRVAAKLSPGGGSLAEILGQ